MEEELKPLFDYSSVQPNNVLFMDDESPPISPKRLKISDPIPKSLCNLSGQDNGKGTNIIDCDEEDWLLPPPPKVSAGVQKLDENSTIKALRLKKQELFSVTQASENTCQIAGGSAKVEFESSSQHSTDKVGAGSSRPSERVKIIISIQDKDGHKQFRVYKDESFEQLFKKYADKVALDLESLVFCFDGDKISPTATPLGLGMEDNDILEVHVKPR